MTKWPLQDAKDCLSELVRKASTEGRQVITLRGNDAVVVIAANEYAQLVQCDSLFFGECQFAELRIPY